MNTVQMSIGWARNSRVIGFHILWCCVLMNVPSSCRIVNTDYKHLVQGDTLSMPSITTWDKGQFNFLHLLFPRLFNVPFESRWLHHVYLNFEFLWLKPFTFQCAKVSMSDWHISQENLFVPVNKGDLTVQIHACSCTTAMKPIVEALYQPSLWP